MPRTDQAADVGLFALASLLGDEYHLSVGGEPHLMKTSVIAVAVVITAIGFGIGFERAGILSATPSTIAVASQAASPAGAIEILRDEWGVPHVFSTTDAGAFRGLGYATAEDRAFQMTYTLRVIQGRLAEVVGDVRHLTRDETSIDNDKKMRTFGFYRAAGEAARRLDAPTRALLDAYSAGVNAYFEEHRADLNPLFARTGLEPEPWTAADCIAAWWHLGQFFAADGTRDLNAYRSRTRTAAGQAGTGRGAPPSDMAPRDDGSSVVQRADVAADWVARVDAYARAHGLTIAGSASASPGGPKFSHAWVVGGRRTTTGSVVLVSDPQTPVTNPSLLYEFHVVGQTFNARGVGVAGSPALLIGFTPNVAWGVTALGADQADLFMLDTEAARPDQYRFDNEWRSMDVRHETITVKGKPSVGWVVRETHLGPVATAFSFARPGEGEVALKRIPMADTNRETIRAIVEMMRAKNARELDAAATGWRFPSANMVFGDREGNIGYRIVAAAPLRSRDQPEGGRMAMPGRARSDDWQEVVPGELLPGVMNPAAGFLYSANHRPVGAWYPIPLGISTGNGGDTTRSWRLRERLQAAERFSPENVLDIHRDSVNPARREIVRVGLHLRDGLRRDLPQDARRALTILEPWYKAGASSSLTSPGAELAVELSIFFRMVSTDLARVYGGGEAGLVYFLKTIAMRLDRDPGAEVSAIEQKFIVDSLAAAWQATEQQYGSDPSVWNRRAREAVTTRRLGYFENLDGFPSVDRSMDLAVPPLTVIDGGTIASQLSQSYTQWVPMHDPDQAMTILPIGQSERAGASSRVAVMLLWSQGRLHAAPLSRGQVEAITVSRRQITGLR